MSFKEPKGAKILLIIFLAIVCLNSSCQREKPPVHEKWIEIYGRDNGHTGTRFPLYRARLSTHWEISPVTDESIADTTKPLIEFLIKDQNGAMVRITVHNFSSPTLEKRIPPLAQITRWRKQFEYIDLAKSSETAVSRGGFSGIRLESYGIIKNEHTGMLAWAMQLSEEHFRNLINPYNNEDTHKLLQLASDYTIKATGNPHALSANKKDIEMFANTFELIEELPENQ